MEKVFLVAYYLSKFDKIAYKNLGYKSKQQAHQQLGDLLGANPNTLKNRRDDFDAIHDNSRVGWYQRPLRPAMRKIAEKFDHLTEIELRTIIILILGNNKPSESVEALKLILDLIKEKTDSTSKAIFPVNRVQTGILAEELFLLEYAKNKKPICGSLIDTRNKGCGYDFRIETVNSEYYIEIKGFQTLYGGILLTGKELETAILRGEQYYIIIVSNINETPIFTYIQNPSMNLIPYETIELIPRVQWIVDERQITKHIRTTEL